MSTQQPQQPYGPQPQHGQPAYGYGPQHGQPQPYPGQWLPGDVDCVGARVGQYILDSLVVGVPMVVLYVIGLVLVHASGGTPAVAVLLFLLALVVGIGGSWLNHGYLGHRWGQTIAMRWLHLRIVKEDGSPPTLGDTTARWILFVVDGLVYGLVAFILVLATPKKQRLGDIAAHTLVVRSGYQCGRK